MRVLTAWTYAVRALAALVLPGHSPRRYWWHAYHSLLPGRGEGLREAAEAYNREARRPTVKSHTVYRTFQTSQRREFVRITEDVQEAVDESGIAEGMVLVSAMHITAGVWVNDDEPGILEDALEWLDKLAPAVVEAGRRTTSRASCCRTPATTATTAAARTTATRTSRTCSCTTRSCCPMTEGRLDLGPWQQVFYAEFDGGRRKRLVIKVLGE